MPILIWIIGWLIALEGILFLVKPEVIRPMIKFFSQGKRLYVPALLRIILAVFFFTAARQCRIPLVIIALGLVLLVSGIMGFTIRLEKLKSMMTWWQEKPLTIIRLISLIVLAFGAAIVYSALP